MSKYSKRKSSLKVYIENAYEKEKYSLKNIDLTEHLSKKELKRWEKLPNSSKERYISKAVQEMQKSKEHQDKLQRGRYIGRSKYKPVKAGEQPKGVSKKNASAPVIKKADVSNVAKEVASNMKIFASTEMTQIEAKESAAQNDSINKQIAINFKEESKVAKPTVGAIKTALAPEMKAVAVTVAPIVLGILIMVILISSAATAILAVAGAKSQDGGKRIVEVALAEEKEGNQKGGNKYWSWYGFNSRVEWCACFVSWCANECGYIDDGIFPKSAAVAGFRSWYDDRGLYRLKGEYTPKAGDLIIFENGMSHIGIVQYVEGNQVVTIEGNTSDIVHSRIYPLDWAGISGYCTPNYPVSESDFTGDTNAEIAWNFLISKGCSPETAAGIMGNLQQESGINPKSEQHGGGPGRGICQWTYGSGRFKALEAKAASMGKNWYDIEPQLEHLWDELSGSESTCKHIMQEQFGGFENFKRSNDIRWATNAFEKAFERAGIPNMENRYRFAESFYAQFNK
ncbi:hypothetical protein M2145_002551 [Lachnospiraceae bacterium PF1-21]